MNTKTESNVSASSLRNPQFKASNAPRVVAAIIAIAVTVVLFDNVAMLGSGAPAFNAGDGQAAAQTYAATRTLSASSFDA